MTDHIVKLGQGAQTLYFVPMDSMGRPRLVSSADYSIVDLRLDPDSADRTVQALTPATLGAASTTLSAAAGPATGEPRRLPVASVASFAVGRTYLVAAASGEHSEAVVVVGIDATNVRLYTAADLRNDYAASDTVAALELEATFPALEANDETEVEDGGGHYQVLWDYTLDGRAMLVPQLIYLSRYDVAPMVTESFVTMAYPSLADRGRGRFDLSSAIAAAQDDLIAELSSAGIDPQYYRSGQAAKVAVRFRAIEYMLRWCQTEADDTRADRYEERYRRLVDNLLQGRPGFGVAQVDRASDVQTHPNDDGLFIVPG